VKLLQQRGNSSKIRRGLVELNSEIMNNEWINIGWNSDCVTNMNLLIGNLCINSGCKVFTTSVLLKASCTAMSDVTLKGGDLLTQNCTRVTIVKN
jgi:hypothetical protein